MSAVLDELAGGDKATRAALRVFADLNQSWPYRTPDTHAPALTAAFIKSMAPLPLDVRAANFG